MAHFGVAFDFCGEVVFNSLFVHKLMALCDSKNFWTREKAVTLPAGDRGERGVAGRGGRRAILTKVQMSDFLQHLVISEAFRFHCIPMAEKMVPNLAIRLLKRA
jgi:hypothetical protein